MWQFGVAAIISGSLVAGCAEPGGTGSAGTMSADCATMKRQQQTLVAQGRQNTQEYRQLLDRYLARCHR